MKKKYSREVLIGLTVLITLLVLFFGINFLKGINLFKASNYYYASYTDVAGLAKSAPVTVNGFQVGLVREIEYEYDNPGHVLVEMSLDKKLKLPQGTRAVISCDMLGTATVVLDMGTGNEYYQVGSRIPGVTNPGLVENLSSGLMPAVEGIFPKVDSLLTAVTVLASDPALLAAIGRLDAISANLETTTRLLGSASSALPRIVTAADSTMTNITALSASLASLSARLDAMPLDSTMTDVSAIAAELRTMSEALNSSQSSLGLLLHDPELYRNLNAAVSDVDSLLVDIKRNPKRYISIKLL